MRLLLALMCVVFVAGEVRADTVQLKDGTAVEGKVVDQSPESVKLDIGGVTLTYYMDEVASVSLSAGAADGAAAVPQPAVLADALDGLGKDQLIRKFVEIYGVRENMQANFNQMASTLKPDEAAAFRDAIKVEDIVQELLPVYEKHFSADDLKAYIRFYGSDAGKRLVQSLPLLMKDSVDVSMKYLQAHLPESLKQPDAPAQGSQPVAAE